MHAYIVDVCRSAVGKNHGLLSHWHPVDLLAAVLDELVLRTGIQGNKVDDVICGCVSQVGAHAGNVGRMAVLASKTFPVEVPSTIRPWIANAVLPSKLCILLR